IALSPSPTSAATTYFASDSMISFSPRRKIGWSSTITMRVLSFMEARITMKGKIRRKGNRDGQTCAFARRGLNVEFASEQPHPLCNSHESLAIWAQRLLKTAAIIEERETHRS